MGTAVSTSSRRITTTTSAKASAAATRMDMATVYGVVSNGKAAILAGVMAGIITYELIR